MEEHARVDGRALRGERTRSALVDAHLALLDEGRLRPTIEEIATRAGVSARSVFQHFEDREALFAAVSARQAERIEALREELPAGGALAERLEAFVAQRARVLEFITPVRRAALLDEPFSAVVSESLMAIRRMGGDEAKALFAPELDAREDRDATAAALVAVTGWSTWENLRRHQGLGEEEAREAMKRAIEALITA
jgi:AcrR family transcriptional regulator